MSNYETAVLEHGLLAAFFHQYRASLTRNRQAKGVGCQDFRNKPKKPDQLTLFHLTGGSDFTGYIRILLDKQKSAAYFESKVIMR